MPKQCAWVLCCYALTPRGGSPAYRTGQHTRDREFQTPTFKTRPRRRRPHAEACVPARTGGNHAPVAQSHPSNGVSPARAFLVTSRPCEPRERDSGVDWSEGWSGTLRHVYVQQGPAGSHGIEGSGDGGPPAVPSLYNATLVGGEGGGAAGQLRDGIQLAGGATFRARNLVVTARRTEVAAGISDECVPSADPPVYRGIEGFRTPSGTVSPCSPNRRRSCI